MVLDQLCLQLDHDPDEDQKSTDESNHYAKIFRSSIEYHVRNMDNDEENVETDSPDDDEDVGIFSVNTSFEPTSRTEFLGAWIDSVEQRNFIGNYQASDYCRFTRTDTEITKKKDGIR